MAAASDREDVYVVAAREKGEGYVMIANLSGEDIRLKAVLEDGKNAGHKICRIRECRVIDRTRTWEKCALPDVLAKDMVLCVGVECGGI